MIHDIVNCSFNNMFKQLDMLIINFDKPIRASIHARCFVRVFKDNTILLTSSDEFFDKNGNELEANTNGTHACTEESLLDINIKRINKLMNGEFVTEVIVSDIKDITISFSNGVKIQILPDCLMKDYEYYRFIKFIPFLDDELKNYHSEHYVVSNVNGAVMTLKQ